MRTQNFLKFTKCLKDIDCQSVGCIDVDGAIKTQEECLHNKRHICVWPYLVRIEFLCHLMHHLAMACRSVLNHPLVIPLTPAPDEDNLRKPWKRNGQHIKSRVTRKKPYNPEKQRCRIYCNYHHHCHCRIQWWIQQLSKKLWNKISCGIWIFFQQNKIQLR